MKFFIKALICAAVIFALFAPAYCEDQCPFAGITPDPINVKFNQQFSVTLKSNPTTGYSWQICEIVNKGIVKLLGSKYVPNKDANLVGAGGKQVWTFKALAKGQARIFLKYVRSWEKNVKPAELKAYLVTIK